LRILITGASGLLGQAIAKLALEREHEVFSIYKEHPTNIGKAYKMNLTDSQGLSELIHELKPEAIVHTAAYTDVDGCELNKELALKVNAQTTKQLAVASNDVDAHMVYVSTDYVFDGEKGFYNEEDTPNPINYYGCTKLKGEEFVEKYAKSWCIVRASVIYGWGGSKLNFATWLIENLKQRKEVKALIDQYVSPTLNTNLAQMLLEIAEREFSGILHTAGASKISRYEFALKFAEVSGLDANLIKPSNMNEMKWRARRPKDSSLNVGKALASLKTKPLKIDEALEVMKRESGA